MERLERGQRVGEYVVDGFLGAGAFGSVYRGVQPVIGKLVAIKVLHRQDPEMITRFVNEARAVNAIRHPNVVDIFAFGQLEDGRHYLVMEWLSGEPLDAYLERIGGRVPPEAVLSVVAPLARALDAAHSARVIHRDLKPSNVFLTVDADGKLVPKLLDFGIAKLVDDEASRGATGTGRAIGTPEYMSPEQCEGPDIDHRSDIYAFGALLFRMLTGAALFEASSVVELMMKQIKEPPRRPSVVSPSLPRSLDGPVLTMLAKDRKERPQTLKAAIATFDAALEEAGLERNAAPPAVVPRHTGAVSMTLSEPRLATSQNLGPPSSRAGLFGAIALVILVLAALPFVLDGGDPDPPPPPPPAPVAPVAAPALVSPPPLPSPPPPPASNTVTLAFTGVPNGTLILSPSGSVLATTPGRLVLPKSDTAVELTFDKSGYLPAKARVIPSASSTISVKLRPRPKPAKRSDKNSVENPYDR